jgi:hypothetical protein
MDNTATAGIPLLLLTVIEGLVPLHLAHLTALSDGDRKRLAEQYADQLAAAADRLTAPGNFEDRRERGQALTALAGGIAAGALQPGGITWAGRHWCTRPHPNCTRPHRKMAAAIGAWATTEVTK